jgi:nitrate reductase alpha subunit
MSHFLDRLTFFTRAGELFSDGHGVVTQEKREWEDTYRARWQHDKIVRSTHGVNCTGSCSWKIYVKGGIVTWETQQTDYPRTRPGLPNHEPRGCQRGASYSWYLYSANRLKHPLMRSSVLTAWEEKRKTLAPVDAWQSIAEDAMLMKKIRQSRGLGGFRRVSWETANELIASANIYTAKKYGPDRIIGFSPIPAMSMVSYAAGSRYLSLIGGVCLSFYDWYCDLPPASPQMWGEQTDVPESADWFNSGYILMWGSNVPQTRTPDAHFMTEVRYRGTKVVSIFPDYSEGAKFGDIWLKPKQGTDAALAMAMGHVVLKEFLVDKPTPYFVNYLKQYSDMAHLVMINAHEHGFVADRFLRASDLIDSLGEKENTEWKTLIYDEEGGALCVPQGSIGFRWTKDSAESGRWNLELKASNGQAINPRLSLIPVADEIIEVSLPYFANREHAHFQHSDHPSVLKRKLAVKKITLANGQTQCVASVYDLIMAQYGVDQGLAGGGVAKSFDEDAPYTPAWQERITGVPRAQVIRVAREFADNAAKTQGKSMVIIGAAMNHWYHMDMNYRGIINLLVFCGCVGQSGGGWAHYVGQEKLRPQTGWLPLAFGLDWHRPPRQMNSTSFFLCAYRSMALRNFVGSGFTLTHFG